MDKSPTFRLWFREVVAEYLGVPADRLAPATVFNELAFAGIVSRQTIYNVLGTAESPLSQKTRGEIFKHLCFRMGLDASAHASRAGVALLDHPLVPALGLDGQPVDSWVIDLLQAMFKDGGAHVEASRSEPWAGCSALVVTSGVEPVRIRQLLVSIDSDADPASDERLYAHVREAINHLAYFESVHLICHRELVGPVLERVSQLRGEAKQGNRLVLERVNTFLGRFFDVNAALDETREWLRSQSDLDDSRDPLPLPWSFTDGPATSPDGETNKLAERAEEMLAEQIEDPTRGVRLLLRGTFGAGKSTVLRLAARTLLVDAKHRSDNAKTPFPLPVVVLAERLQTADDAIMCIQTEVNERYKTSATRHLVEHLIRRGHLAIMIDGIDESPTLSQPAAFASLLRKLPGLGLSANGQPEPSRYVITYRPEMFRNEKEELDCVSINSFRRVTLGTFRLDDVRAHYGNRLGQAVDNLLGTDSDIGPGASVAKALLELSRRPLFWHFLDEHLRPEDLQGLLRRGEFGSFSQPVVRFYELFTSLVESWIDRESDRARPKRFHLGKLKRMDFCRRMAEELFRRRGASAMAAVLCNGQLQASGLTLADFEALVKSSPHARSVNDEDLLDFLHDARLSMLFVRHGAGTDDSIWGFADPALEEFFLASALVHAVLRAPEAPSRTLAPLCRTQLAVRPGLLSLLFAGSLYQQEPNGSPGIFRLIFDEARDRKSLLSRQFRRHPLSLINLVVLAAQSSELAEGRVDIDLRGLHLPGLRLHANSTSDCDKRLLRVEAANLEAAELLPKDAWTIEGQSLQEEAGGQPLSWTARDAEWTIQARLSAWSVIDKLLPKDKFHWTLVPGGHVRVLKFESHSAGHRAHGDNLLPSLASGVRNIFVPTFLIQTNPVSNKSFLDFLTSDAGSEFQPRRQRIQTSNPWYLADWTYWERVLGADLTKWLSSRKDKNTQTLFDQWLEWPATRMNWMAAAAFADFHGLDLPTEAEFEVAARAWSGMKLSDSLKPDSLANGMLDFPSGKDDGKGRPLHAEFSNHDFDALRGVWPRIPEFPTFSAEGEAPLVASPSRSNATAANSGRRAFAMDASYESWRSEFPEHHQPPRFLINAVGTWLRDEYRPVWPPTTPSQLGTTPDTAVYFPLQGDNDDIRDQKVKEGRGTYRAVRGRGQMVGEPRGISDRFGQPQSNVNPDVGLRCVKRIWADTIERSPL